MDHGTPELLARIETLEAAAARAVLNAIELQAAQRNRAFTSSAAGATTAGQATITPIAAAKLIARASGLFLTSVSFSWASATAGDACTVTLQSVTDNVLGTPLTLGNVAQGGPGTNGIALPGGTAVTNNGFYLSTAGAGITITGGSGPVILYATTQTIGTAAVGMTFSWTGILRLSNNIAESPFALGSTAMIVLNVTNSVAPRATGNINIDMVELA